MEQESNNTTSPLNGAIARSRSRYRGTKSSKGLSAAQFPPSQCSELSHRPQDCTLPTSKYVNTGVRHSTEADPVTVLTAQADRIGGKEKQRTAWGRSGRTDKTPPVAPNKDKQLPKTEHGGLHNQASRQSPVKQRNACAIDTEVTPIAYPVSISSAHEPDTSRSAATRLGRSTNANGCQREQDRYHRPARTSVRHAKHTLASEASILKSVEGSAPGAPTNRPALPEKGQNHCIAGRDGAGIQSKSSGGNKKPVSAPLHIESDQAHRPAFDAPISAVNAGERRVTVKYDQSATSVPVSPSTNSADIVRAANSQLSAGFAPNNTVLVESFRQLGLERPLRRYEHIRDVMNSWANDAQNALIIIPSPTGGWDDDLDMESVSEQQTGDTSVQLHHSHRPGSWEKRWITLRADGQVLAVKKDGLVNLCHLSDFDIYVPTARQLSKKIIPPKKFCFAIKSQQKSSMFLATENFVHFFSTNDKILATQWYNAVQGWRSWYLVHVMGKRQKGGKRDQPSIVDEAQPSLSNCSAHDSRPVERPFFRSEQEGLEKHRVRPLALRLGLIEMLPPDHNSSSALPAAGRGQARVASPKKLTKGITTGSSTARKPSPSLVQAQVARQAEPEPFAATGLLGRTYTIRKQAQQERDEERSAARDITADTPVKAHTRLKRTSSQPPKPRPLVDLSPHYQGLPQQYKGHGVAPQTVPAGGLVEAATSREQGTPIPPATVSRRPAESQPSVQRLGTVQGRDSGGSPAYVKPTSSAPDISLFTAGLLAVNSQSQGDRRHGKGVKTGDRNAESPMIDMNEGSQYAPGSLLANVEKCEGHSAGPRIERRKRRELDIAVGEST